METYDVYLYLDNAYVLLNEANEIQLPLSLNFNIDGTLDNGMIQFKGSYSKQIKPFTKCKIVINKIDATTKTFYFYTANATKKKIALYKNIYMHDVFLIEPTKILERYLLGARTFSEGSSFFTSNKELIELIIDTCYPKRVDDANKLNITLSTENNEAFDLKAKELFTNKQTTLFEALNEIGGRINAIPRMVDFETLTFQFRENKNDYLLTQSGVEIFSEKTKQDLDDYATSIQSHIPNVIDLDSPMFNLNNILGYSLRSESVRITQDTAILILDKPIYKIKSIKIAPTAETEASVQTPSGNKTLAIKNPVDITNYVFEKKQWEQLKYYESGLTTTQLSSVYYTQNTNKIEGFFGYHDNWLFRSGVTIQALLLRALKAADFDYIYWGEDVIGVIGFGGTNKPYLDLEYIVEYYPTDEVIVNAYKERWETDERELNTLVYNQSSNVINFNYYGENLQTTIKRIGNRQVEIYFKTKNKNIPELTDKISFENEDYFISEIAVEYFRNFKKIKVVADKNFTRFNPDISLDSQIRLFNIPSDNYINDRIIKTESFIFLDKEFKYNKTYIDLNINLKQSLMESFRTKTGYFGDPLNNTVPHALIRTYGSGISEQTFLKPINFLTTNKALLMSFGFNENIAGGYQKTPTTEDSFGALNKVVPYVNSKGEATDCYVEIKSNFDRNTYNANVTPVDSTTNGSSGYNEDRVYIKYYLENIKKDTREIIKFNNQTNILSDTPDYIVGDAFSRLLKRSFENYIFDKRYVYFSSNKLTSNFKEDLSKTATEIIDTIATIGIETFKLDKGNYSTINMGVGTNNYLQVTISSDLKTTYNSYAILDENYKTIFISNDMEADKIYFNFADNYKD